MLPIARQDADIINHARKFLFTKRSLHELLTEIFIRKTTLEQVGVSGFKVPYLEQFERSDWVREFALGSGVLAETVKQQTELMRMHEIFRVSMPETALKFNYPNLMGTPRFDETLTKLRAALPVKDTWYLTEVKTACISHADELDLPRADKDVYTALVFFLGQGLRYRSDLRAD